MGDIGVCSVASMNHCIESYHGLSVLAVCNSLQDSIALVRSRLASNARESEKQNRRLQEEKEAIQGHFHTIKTQMNRARACERGQLAKLTLHSNAAIKKLQQLIEKVGQESNRIPEQRFKSMCLSSLSFQYTSP